MVFLEGKPIWIMNYYGFVVSMNNSEEIYGFLRKAMSLVEEGRPFRGCANLKDESRGDVDRFVGTERIFFKEEEVYRLEYHGGVL